MTVLFFSLCSSLYRCPPSFSCSHFPCTMPLHAPLSYWATSITKMAFAQHVHAHTRHTETHAHAGAVTFMYAVALLGNTYMGEVKNAHNLTSGHLNKQKKHIQLQSKLTLKVTHPFKEQTVLSACVLLCVRSSCLCPALWRTDHSYSWDE